MEYLKKYGLNEIDFTYLKKNYNNKILSNIIYKQDNVEKIVKELQEKDFDIKYLLLNRLDIFLIDIDDFKQKIKNYNIDQLKEDFSIFS